MKLSKTGILVASVMAISGANANESEDKNNEVIVVTATKSEQSIEQAPATVSVIENEEITRIPATDVTQALQTVAGIQIDKLDGDEPSISIRGLDSSFTLILVNGRRINSREAIVRGSFDVSSIPMSAIDRVEVVRGPMSTLYGSEALGGVVNIILKTPADEMLIAGNLSYTHPQNGGGELRQLGAFVSGALIPQTLYFTAALDASQKAEWHPTDSTVGNFNRQESQDRAGIDVGLTWLPSDKDKFLFDLGFMTDDREFPGGDRKPESISFYESDRIRLGAGYERQWSWGSSDLNYYFEQAEVMEDNSHPVLTKTTGKQTNHNIDGKAAFGLHRQQVTVGFDLSDTELTHPRDYEGSAGNSQFAVYVQDEISIADPVVLTLSGRYTHHSEFGDNFSPRAYLVVTATDRLTLKGGVGTGFKAPALWRSAKNFSMPSCRGGCLLVGNPNLKPETSLSYELSALYSGDGWFARLTGFDNKVKDMITRDFETTIGQGPNGIDLIQHINLEEVKTQGFELEAKFDISADVVLNANLTYTNSEDVITGEELTFTPDVLGYLGADWYVNPDVSLYAQLNYTGKQFNWSREKLDGYELVNLGGSYNFTDNLKLKLGVSNLFDKRLDKSDQDYGYVEVGRAYYANLDFSY